MIRRHTVRIIRKLLFFVLLLFLGVMFLSPLISTVLAGLRTDADLMRNGLFALPEPPYLGGFGKVWEEGDLGTYMRNSFIVTLVALIGTVICATLGAYALSQYTFRFKNVVFLVFMMGLFFPPQVYIVPVYFLANTLRIYNTYYGLMAVHIAYQLPFSMLMLRGFFRTIPTSFIDAARIDGASDLHILWRIILPLSLPVLGSLSILLFTWIWNDFFWALSMSHTKDTQTIMIGISAFRGRLAYNWNSEAASSLISMFPPLVIFFLFQKLFIKGIRSGGIK